MAVFITRVELHNADDNDYKVLHVGMKELNFSINIKDIATGKKYHLPTATYYSFGLENSEDVVKLAKSAASKTGRRFSIISAKSTDVIWSGLDEA